MAERGLRKSLTGTVTSDKMKKTLTVSVERLEPHPKYGKYMRRRTVCKVHDENSEAKMGDTVEIMASRPLSKTKRWRLVRVVTRANIG